MKIFKGVFFLIFCILLTSCSQINNTPPKTPEAIEGIINLQDWDYETDGSTILGGEWTFYWDELLQPDQITTAIKTGFVQVPEPWSKHEIGGNTFPVEGYATYHLTIYLPDIDQVYGIYTEGQGSAYKLWVDDVLVLQNGQVGTDLGSMDPDKIPSSGFFQPTGEKVEIVIQISNFHHRKSGFRNTLVLDLADPTHSNQLQNWFIEAISVGALFMMGLYHFFIYLFRKKNIAPLYFAILAWGTSVRLGITNQNTLMVHLPLLTWETALRLEYLVFFLAIPFFALFMRSLYPKDIHSWFVQLSISLGIVFSLFMLLTDTLSLSYSVTYYQIVYFLSIIYYFYFLGRIIRNRREGAIYIALASLILMSGIIVETLYIQNILPFGQFTSFSFIAYIVAQGILLSSRFSKSFERVESLSVELEETNVSLKQSERKYRAVFEESKDMLFIAALDAQIEDVSPSCEEVLGYTKEELIQMKIMDVSAHPEIRSEFEKSIATQGSVRNFEVELLRKDGQKIDALVTATLRYDENDEIVGIQGSVRDITARKQAEAERIRSLKLEQIAITDPLTNSYNRRFFYEVAEKEIERAKRSGSFLSILIIDIDQFKSVNDKYGHLIGDQVLINFAELCQENIRSMDVFARFGGDEFVIMMPEIDPRSALETAERLREIVSEKPLVITEEADLAITISIGIANSNNINSIEIETLLAQADKSLYQAKEMGRDRVVIWDDVKQK